MPDFSPCPPAPEATLPCRIPVAPPDADGLPAPPAPTLVGFSLGEAIGEGGFARVWAARREEDGAALAIKIGHARGAVLIERFRREASALARIGPPHVARLHGLGQLSDGRPYLAMERLVGQTLAAELGELHAPPDPSFAVQRADAILGALSAAHAHGITHRDLKPSNLFIAQPGARVVLLDFGLSHGALVAPDEGAAQTRAGVAVGSPAYMAPEQIRCDPTVDARADIYAFGVLLFELLTLRTPFIGDGGTIEHGHLALRPPRPSELAPVPAALEALTLACLAKDPARRPRSVDELRSALAEASATPSQPTPSVAAPSSGKSRLVAEAGHPAVLLVAETKCAAPPVIAAVTGRGGFVVRRRGHCYVSVFPAGEIDGAPHAALAAARELVEQHGARAALHLDSITLRHRDQGPPAAYGAPVDHPEGWSPAEPWSGLRVTAELEQILGEPASEEAARGSGAEATLETARDNGAQASAQATAERSAEEARPLIGRDEVRAALAGSAARAFDGTCPGLFTLLGEDGLGKSRLAAAAAELGHRLAADAQIISLRATPRAADAGDTNETAALFRWLLKEPLPPRREIVRALAEGLRRQARERPVAVILDDAHRADDALLDALEYATLDGAGLRLWVVVVAHPRLEASRPMWGARTQRHDRLALSPLDEGAGTALAAWLLRPADYPPMETLRRLATWAGGNPACLVDLVGSLQRAGAVRRRPNGRGYDVTTEALAALPPSPPRQWLAARRLAELPAALAALARICAVLGPAFTEEELAAVLEGLERSAGVGSPLDAGVGLSALSSGEIVVRSEGARWSFPSAVLQEAIEALVDPADRAEIHRQALSYCRARAAGAAEAAPFLPALARHAAGCGERAEATLSQILLGEAALTQHRYMEAELCCSAALELAFADDAPLRARALAARGRARYRVHRVREAREDFSAALALEEALGDLRRRAALLLEDATALDWDRQFEASARRVEEARAIIPSLFDPRLTLRLRVAEGRTCHRRKETQASIQRLTEAGAEAAALGEDEQRVVAWLLLAYQLASVGRLDEAERRFDEVIALAERTHDLPHLGAAYGNRVELWMARRQPDRALEDIHRVVALAREIGNPWLEHAAAYNVALVLYRSDALEEALTLARRACLLSDRAVATEIPAARLLLTEILLLLDRPEEAARLVEAMGASAFRPDPDDIPCQQMLQPVLAERGMVAIAPPEGGWEDTLQLAEAHGLLIESKLRLLYWRARMALEGGRREEARCALAAARRRRGESAMWLGRFEALEAQLADAPRRP